MSGPGELGTASEDRSTKASSEQTHESTTRPPVYVHIGTAKTGTTHLQNLFDRKRDELREGGLLYPPCGGSGHVLEALDLRRAKFKDDPDPSIAGSWRRMAAAIREWNGPTLISSELLAPARPAHIERAMTSLDFAEVHIVITVRDLARQLPAAWQEWVKNRGQESFAEWLEAVHDPENHNPGRHFWALHDIARILEKWSAHVPREHVHVVTVPQPGGDRSLLWTRFAQVIGVDPERLGGPSRGTNPSLGAAEVSVVREVNIALGGDAFPWPEYDRLMKWYLSPELAKRRGATIDLPEAEYQFALERSQLVAKAIADAGYDVVGDLDDLIPTTRPTGIDPDQVPGELTSDVGVAGITSLIHLLAGTGGHPTQTNDDGSRLRSELDRAQEQLREHRDLPPLERTKQFLVELSDQVGWLGHARRGYVRLRRRGGETPTAHQPEPPHAGDTSPEQLS